MRVTKENSAQFLLWLDQSPCLALDTETTGLYPYQGDRPFSLVFADDKTEWYLDARDDGSAETLQMLKDILSQCTQKCFYMQNAKFDLHHLAQVGVDLLKHMIVDTAVMARLHNSWLPSYSLGALGKYYLGDEKSDEVKNWCDSNPDGKTVVPLPNGRNEVRYHYDRAPSDMVERYACLDARLTFDLGRYLHAEYAKKVMRAPEFPIINSIEIALTPVVFKMERSGIRVDLDFVEKSIAEEMEAIRVAEKIYEDLTGKEHVKSAKAYAAVFGEGFGAVTEKGNLSFDKEVLGKIKDPAAEAALEIARAKASLNFFLGFKRFVDPSGILHTDFRQGGTRTGRFSSANPNLQNLKRPEDGEEVTGPNVRRALVPFEDHCLVMIDYSQQEYRLMLDYAGEMNIIQSIIDGADVHAAMAEAVGIVRQRAKTLNFGLIYGAGAMKISEMLGIELSEAKALITRYFGKLPKVRAFMRKVKDTVLARGFIRTWAGREIDYQYPAQENYAAVNHLIQGGCGDITKRAMVLIDERLRERKARSKMSLTIHDELVFNIHRSELELVPELQQIMERAYPHIHLPMKAEVSHSWTSLGDKVKGYPTASM